MVCVTKMDLRYMLTIIYFTSVINKWGWDGTCMKGGEGSIPTTTILLGVYSSLLVRQEHTMS